MNSIVNQKMFGPLPVPISGFMEAITKRLFLEAIPMNELRARWGQIAPARLAPLCQPERVNTANSLTVHCQDVIVRNELSLWHTRRMLPLVKSIPGFERIRDIHFHV